MFIIDREFKFKQCRISGITYKESFDLNFIKKDFISQNETNSQEISNKPKSTQCITDQINIQDQN